MPAAIKNILTSVLIISALAGCSKEDDSPVDVTDEKPVIRLIVPTDAEKVDPCCTHFSWESKGTGNFRLSLSDNENFTNLLVDSIVSTSSFQYNRELKPGKKYYWRVIQGADQGKAAIEVKDVLAGIKENYYNVPIRKYSWSRINGIESDTTFTGTVNISRVDDKIRLQYASDNIDRTMEMRQMATTNTLYYFSPFYGSNGGHLTYNYKNDSIYFTNKSGGLGGGIVWNLRMKK